MTDIIISIRSISITSVLSCTLLLIIAALLLLL